MQTKGGGRTASESAPVLARKLIEVMTLVELRAVLKVTEQEIAWRERAESQGACDVRPLVNSVERKGVQG